MSIRAILRNATALHKCCEGLAVPLMKVFQNAFDAGTFRERPNGELHHPVAVGDAPGLSTQALIQAGQQVFRHLIEPLVKGLNLGFRQSTSPSCSRLRHFPGENFLCGFLPVDGTFTMGPEISTACRRPLCFLGAAALASSGAGPSVINTSSLIKEVVGAGLVFVDGVY